MNTSAPEILNTLCATAVRFASRDCPIEANSAVMVVPMLSPSRMGMEPARPQHAGHAVGASPARRKLCSTAMVALELCTTRRHHRAHHHAERGDVLHLLDHGQEHFALRKRAS
ncbi:hypothetical protein [Paraeggerthella sp.]|uniref:hypothetical protein n=1 Tax=Paraeggerthella sp. TaxID=2897350 RepID=UPI003527119F